MELINNRDQSLGDELKAYIKKGSKVQIAAICFSMYAFDALKDVISNMVLFQHSRGGWKIIWAIKLKRIILMM